jgi:hypothetical protein
MQEYPCQTALFILMPVFQFVITLTLIKISKMKMSGIQQRMSHSKFESMNEQTNTQTQ